MFCICFREPCPAWFLRDLCGKHGYGLRQGIYNAGVVIWLMIWQRLQGNRSQQAAVQHLLQGGCGRDADRLQAVE